MEVEQKYDVVVDGTKKVLFTGTRHQCERWIFANGDLNVMYAMEKAGKKRKSEPKGEIKNEKREIKPLF